MWKTLIHNGPYVQPKYKKIPGVNLIYKKKDVDLPAEMQQYFFLYCKYSAPKDDLFVKNFFSTVFDIAPQSFKDSFTDWSSDNCDLSQFYNYINDNTVVLTKEEKEEKKKVALEMKEYYSVCILDGEPQVIGGYAVEPASIFKGLGDNPNRGKIKLPITPEEITINTSLPPSDFPKPPYGKWGSIIKDTSKIYTASYRINVTGKIKYVYLNRSSNFKTNSEIEKYESARNLSLIVDDIREEYHALLRSDDRRKRELGLAVYLIDRYAFRVGNEPSTGSGAETTGATTLKRENVILKKGNKVEFNFIAKDSIVYNETKLMEPDAYAVMKELVSYGGAVTKGAKGSSGSSAKATKGSSGSSAKATKGSSGSSTKASANGSQDDGLAPPLCTSEEIYSAVPKKVLREFCKYGTIGDSYCAAFKNDKKKPVVLTKKESELLKSLDEEFFVPHKSNKKQAERECPLNPWGGSKDDQIFSISASTVNKWLESKMPGLTAKVFRTYNASILIKEKLLDKDMSKFSDDKKLSEFTKVNTEIAIICNHKRAVAPEKREKIDAAIKEIDNLEAPTAKQISKREKLLRDKVTLGVALNTSRLNYIDPRLVYTWCSKNEIDPKKIYAKAALEATEWASKETDFTY